MVTVVVKLKDRTVKVSEETYQDLLAIQKALIKYGTDFMPKEFREMIESGKIITLKRIVAFCVKAFKYPIDQMVEMQEKAKATLKELKTTRVKEKEG